MNIPISKITLDAGTQQRDLDREVIDRYAALIKDDVPFPPISLTCNGSSFWVTDGFHRVAAHIELGRTTIEATVTPGSLQDARWRSFAANKDHGLPRPKGAVTKILETILLDEEWSKTSLMDIADHVGCGKTQVWRMRKRLETPDPGEPEPEPTPEPTADGEPTPEPTSDGDATPEPEPTPEPTTKTRRDAVGQEIPANLYDIFDGAGEVLAYADETSSLFGQVCAAAKEHEKVWCRCNINDYRATLKKLSANLRLGAPYVVCVYCGGVQSTKCVQCKGLGWLSKLQWRVVPEELKP